MFSPNENDVYYKTRFSLTSLRCDLPIPSHPLLIYSNLSVPDLYDTYPACQVPKRWREGREGKGVKATGPVRNIIVKFLFVGFFCPFVLCLSEFVCLSAPVEAVPYCTVRVCLCCTIS